MEDLFQLGVKAIIQNSKGEFLLMKAVSRDNIEYWDFPGGRIQKGGDLIEALKREVFEETGITQISTQKFIGATITKIRVKSKSIEKETFGLVIFAYSVSIPEDSQIVISDEHTGFNWCSKQETAKLISPKYNQEFIDLLNSL